METLTAEVNVVQPRELADYRAALGKLMRTVVHGGSARALISVAVDSLDYTETETLRTARAAARTGTVLACGDRHRDGVGGLQPVQTVRSVWWRHLEEFLRAGRHGRADLLLDRARTRRDHAAPPRRARRRARVVDVATGSGYSAALLAHRLGDGAVLSVDVDPYLTKVAAQRLARMGRHPRIETVDTTGPLPATGYDRLVSMVSARGVPASWLAALRPGGRLVATIAFTSLMGRRRGPSGRHGRGRGRLRSRALHARTARCGLRLTAARGVPAGAGR